jgi:hypothetical protein
MKMMQLLQSAGHNEEINLLLELIKESLKFGTQ